jgi:hypothetical protein
MCLRPRLSRLVACCALTAHGFPTVPGGHCRPFGGGLRRPPTQIPPESHSMPVQFGFAVAALRLGPQLEDLAQEVPFVPMGPIRTTMMPDHEHQDASPGQVLRRSSD